MKKLIPLIFLIFSIIALGINPYKPDKKIPKKVDDNTLVFSEEFNYTGKPGAAIWNYEQGFKRNNELQWYQRENANWFSSQSWFDCGAIM